MPRDDRIVAYRVQALFIALAAIVAVGHLLGSAVSHVGRPSVIVEMLAGILAGPALFSGVIAEYLLATGMRPRLSALANPGLALFMFSAGYELDLVRLRSGQGHGFTASRLHGKE